MSRVVDTKSLQCIKDKLDFPAVYSIIYHLNYLCYNSFEIRLSSCTNVSSESCDITQLNTYHKYFQSCFNIKNLGNQINYY